MQFFHLTTRMGDIRINEDSFYLFRDICIRPSTIHGFWNCRFTLSATDSPLSMHLRSECQLYHSVPEALPYMHAVKSYKVILNEFNLIISELPGKISILQVERCVSMSGELLKPGRRGIFFPGRMESQV